MVVAAGEVLGGCSEVGIGAAALVHKPDASAVLVDGTVERLGAEYEEDTADTVVVATGEVVGR